MQGLMNLAFFPLDIGFIPVYTGSHNIIIETYTRLPTKNVSSEMILRKIFSHF